MYICVYMCTCIQNNYCVPSNIHRGHTIVVYICMYLYISIEILCGYICIFKSTATACPRMISESRLRSLMYTIQIYLCADLYICMNICIHVYIYIYKYCVPPNVLRKSTPLPDMGEIFICIRIYKYIYIYAHV